MPIAWVVFLWAILIVAAVLFLTWFGPRRKQWRTHQPESDGQSDPPLT
jgi:hypothetical protein